MKFLVSEIKSAHAFELEEEIPAQNILGEPPAYVNYRSPLQAKAEARYTEAEILVTGVAEITISLSCARCLEIFEKKVVVPFRQSYPSTLEEIDVADEIRDSIIVELPVLATCRENCAGICPTCGANRNTDQCRCVVTVADSRWDALKKIKLK